MSQHKSLTKDLIKGLAHALVHVSDHYPLSLRTERDFFPLVEMYFHEKVPGFSCEHDVDDGRIDFRIGGSNPGLLELAVCPRRLKDHDSETLKIPGHSQQTQLQPSTNRPELSKLSKIRQSKAKNRHLLLIDLSDRVDHQSLLDRYQSLVQKRECAVTVTIASRSAVLHTTLAKNM